MKLRDTQFLAALRTAQRFLVANDATLGGINATGARKTLDEMIDTIGSLRQTQGARRIQAIGGRSNELRLAAELRRRCMRPIVEIARAKLPEVAKLVAITLPPGNRNSTELATRAREMGEAVQAYADQFIAAGLPSDFITQLDAAAKAVEDSVTEKGEHRANRRTATDGIAREVKAARKAVKVLDALVQAKLAHQEPLVTGWRSAVRAVRGGRSAVRNPTPATEPSTQLAA